MEGACEPWWMRAQDKRAAKTPVLAGTSHYQGCQNPLANITVCSILHEVTNEYLIKMQFPLIVHNMGGILLRKVEDLFFFLSPLSSGGVGGGGGGGVCGVRPTTNYFVIFQPGSDQLLTIL